MTRPRAIGLGLALVAAGALVLLAATGPIWTFVRAAGAPTEQRPLAGSPAAGAQARGPTRIVLIDGLSRDDATRLPSLRHVCARGLDLVVDVGFPTKSLPVQYVLWTGRTTAQAGLSFDNDPMPAPPHAIPAQAPGSIAVVENTRRIAGSFGFAQVLPDDGADADLPEHDPSRAAAWRARGFADAAVGAISSTSPLVLVHVLAVDDAAHAGGRDGDDYAAALAYADAVLDRVVAAVPTDAALLVLADHGHVMAGGHGDAEPEVRFVRACIAPAPLASDARDVHLIDLARWLGDRAGAGLAADARGRPLAIALAHADPDATLPAPSLARWIPAIALLLVLLALTFALACARRAGAPAWTLAYPLAIFAIARLVSGLPTLSHRPHLSLAWIATAIPIAVVAARLARGTRRARAIPIALIGPALALAIAFAILSGVPAALAGGPPARVPWWTGELLFWLAQLAAALAFAGAAIAAAALRPGSGQPAPGPAEVR